MVSARHGDRAAARDARSITGDDRLRGAKPEGRGEPHANIGEEVPFNTEDDVDAAFGGAEEVQAETEDA